MEQTEILRILNRYNPWWNKKEIPSRKISPFKRGDFYMLKKNFEREEIISLVGPRRVGKTILLHQLIKDLLDSGIGPERVLYLSIDEIELIKGGAQVGDIIETYFQYIVKKPLDSLDQTHYLFLDEIQEIPDWEKILKNWQDLGYNIKFIISGSSSIWISKGTEESLLGRIRTSLMMPLKFSEILRYRNILPEDFFITRKEVSTSLLEAIQKKDLSIFEKKIKELIGTLTSKKESIEIELNRYFIVGGYPEFLDENDYNFIGSSIRDKIKLIFYKDIVRYFKIRNPSVLEDLFKFLSQNSGNKLNITSAANMLDIQRPTIKDYLKYLTKAYLIKSSQFYSYSRRKRIRKQEKVYVLDPGIRNGLVDFIDDELLKNETELGMVVEGVLFDHLIRLKFNLEPGPEAEIFYWYNKKEIDFVSNIKRKAIPIESKFRSKINSDSFEAIWEFMRKHKSPFGIIVTKKDFGVKDNIIMIPLWVFLTFI